MGVKLTERSEGSYVFCCPGCEDSHEIWSGAPDRSISWDFNGDLSLPTFRPSLRVWWDGVVEEQRVHRCCHSFITNGYIQFLSDSTHKLAGQTVEIPDVED